MKPDLAFSVAFTHRLRFGRDLLGPRSGVLGEILSSAFRGARLLILIDDAVAAAHPELSNQILATLTRTKNVVAAGPPLILPGGETIKNDSASVERLLRQMHAAGLCRQSYVLAIGGGALLDAAGYAAALLHRGVRLIRVPSTTLAQADAGVGVKNGVNAFGQKNFLGTFAPPWAVLNDESLLATLSERDWRCGFAEAVKVGLLKDAGLFERIERDADRVAARDEETAIPMVRASALLHRDHVVAGGDPLEQGGSRPLDFGHWAAHKLEVLSGFELRHGEAVAIGMALDLAYAARVGVCEAALVQRVRDCLQRLGFELWHPALVRVSEVLEGLEEFRAHLGGPLTITLVSRPGAPVEIHEINEAAMRAAIRGLREVQPAAA